MKLLLILGAFAAACAAWAQAPDVAWPREVKASDGTTITVYQPQVERWADNNLSGRAAVSVLRPGEKEPHYGMIELSARTEIDKSADLVVLSALRVTKSNFPGASAEEAQKYLATLRAAVTRQSWPVSAQALQANLAIAQARTQKGVAVKNEPPQVIFRTTPSMLVLVDGEPALRPAKHMPSLWRVINTTALILQEPQSKTFLLWAAGRWWQSPQVAGEWKPAPSVPDAAEKARAALAKEFDPLEAKDGPVGTLIVATKPTELLQSTGEPKLAPIPGTELLYVTNSKNAIFLVLGAQTYYVLISGRWFTAKALTGPWGFVAAKALPADFARIPADHAMADVLISVPGTPQAREAAIANQIPQTANVQRDVQPTPVQFDGGEPKWQPIDGTPLSYAPNTHSPVIRVDPKSYYMVQNGVWFTAAVPVGPYAVAASVPPVIYSIPPSSPVHYMTYVRVYSSTPTTVLVGYTPGYHGTVMTTDGTVVYGTGYAYPVYIGTYWYPPPPTYGWGFGFTVGFFWGAAIAGGGWHHPCCWGGGGGVYISHHHHNNINIDNNYNRWGNKSQTVTGPRGNTATTRQVGNTTLAKGAGSNNVYAGRDGEVYRRNDSGQWQQYEGKGQGWSDMEKQRPSAETRPAADTRPSAGTRPSAETRQSLDRQHQSRETGAQRAQQFHAGGGFQGGGGMRGGGGRGGGRR